MNGNYFGECTNEERDCGNESVLIEVDLHDSPMSASDGNVEWCFTGECAVCGKGHTLTVYGTVQGHDFDGD
tara:strand:- start:345 stop:557 length:213 start_codon:yes stop_codon:yes gene_type:complete